MLIETTGRCAMIEALRREGARGPWLALLREVLALAGPDTQFLHHAERPWSSNTFGGSRHTIRLSFAGLPAIARGEAFIAALPDHEFTLSRRIVADATIALVEHDMTGQPPVMTLEVELLVLDDT